MSTLRDDLIQRLESLPDVRVDFYKNTDLLCVHHKGKEIAHFQNEHEIDIRLTPAIIKKRGLRAPAGTASHPDRPKGSRWIVQSFKTDPGAVLELIAVATQV